MMEWFEQFTALQRVFAVLSGIGGLVFFVRLVLMIAGFDTDGDGDMDSGGGDLDADEGSSDHGFRLLSIQGLSAFSLMFGLVGLAINKDAGIGWIGSLAGALTAGLAAVWLTALLFRSFSKLQSSGTLELKNAVGRVGRIYLTIPEQEEGQIEVSLQGRLMVLPAVSSNRERIPTDAKVKVIGLEGERMLVVRRV